MTDIDRKTGMLIAGVPAVQQGIENILRTRKGKRVMRPEFGISFQNGGGTAGPGLLKANIEAECLAALLQYEPRIEVIDIVPNIDADGNLSSVKVTFDYKEDGTRHDTVVTYSAFERTER